MELKEIDSRIESLIKRLESANDYNKVECINQITKTLYAYQDFIRNLDIEYKYNNRIYRWVRPQGIE